jgi:RimJ/RimL family protein N-acetyltransferase
MSVTVRPATAADFEAFCADRPPFRVLAWTAEHDGRIIGIGGLTFPPGSVPFVFTEFGDEARALPVALHKTGLRFMQAAKAMGMKRVRATTEADFEAGARWLERLGFVEVAMTDNQKVFEWRPSH